MDFTSRLLDNGVFDTIKEEESRKRAMLEKEYEVFKKNVDTFVKDHPGEYVVIKGETIIGFYKSLNEAFQSVAGKHKPGTFLVQQCIPLEDSVQRFHSRVEFS